VRLGKLRISVQMVRYGLGTAGLSQMFVYGDKLKLR